MANISNSTNFARIVKEMTAFPKTNNALYFYFKSSAIEMFLETFSSESNYLLKDLQESYSQFNIKLERTCLRSHKVDSIDSIKEQITSKLILKLSKSKDFIDINFNINNLISAKNVYDIIKVMSVLYYFCIYEDCFDEFTKEFNNILFPIFDDNIIKLDAEDCCIFFNLAKKTNELC